MWTGATLLLPLCYTTSMDSIYAAVAAVSLFSGAQTGTVAHTMPVSEPLAYVQSEQHALVNPAVVRILHEVKGEVTVQPLSLDVESMSIVRDWNYSEPLVREVDTTVSGTGFSISEDGLFVTNAHVATPDLYRSIVAFEVLVQVLYVDYLDLVMRYGQEHPRVTAFEEVMESMSEGGEDTKRMREQLYNLVTFTDDGSRLAVLPQDLSAHSTEELVDVGQSVTVRSVDPMWFVTDKDVALLSVDDGASMFRIPAIALASSTELDVNTTISVYGYPGDTDLSTTTALSVTVTQGHVTSIKSMPGSNISTYQIDAKIQKGSSGGPLVDAAGRVVGVVTAETGAESGDNFGFALPVALVYELLDEAGVPVVETQYQAHMREGFALQDERHCKRAIESFESARGVALAAPSAQALVDRVIADCEDLIASGQSIDNVWDEFMEFLAGIGLVVWLVIIGSGFVLTAVAVVGVVLFRKLQQGQAQIDALEEELDEQDQDHQETPRAAPNVAAAPELVSESELEPAAIPVPAAPAAGSIPQETEVVPVEDSDNVDPTIPTEPPIVNRVERPSLVQEAASDGADENEPAAPLDKPPVYVKEEETGAWYIARKPPS